MIYFVQGERSGMVKIGYSNSPARRIGTLRTASPEPLRVLAVIEGTAKDERELHWRFARERSHGEWFHPRDSLFRFLERLNSDAPPTDPARARHEGRRRRRSEVVTRERLDALARAADAAGMRPLDYVTSVVLPAVASSDPPSKFSSPAVDGG